MTTREEHYESKFEFPLRKLIKKHAEEKDISYVQACAEVTPEYEKGIRYRDIEFENAEIGARRAEMQAQVEEEIAEAKSIKGGK